MKPNKLLVFVGLGLCAATLSACVEQPVQTMQNGDGSQTVVVPQSYVARPYYNYGLPAPESQLNRVMPPGTCAKGITGTVYCNQPY